MNEPMTPADCDLQDFAYMPLDVRRLRDSDLAATESPEACWAAVLLWAASWHQVPAASLPDDDRVLSNLAGYGRVVTEWQRIKDGALRGWVKCSDGRLYHPVVAEKANESWASKLKHAYGKMMERTRKVNKARAEKHLALIDFPQFDEWNAAGRLDPVPPESAQSSAGKIESSAGKKDSSAGIPPENALKGEGEGEGKGKVYKKEIQGRTHTVLVHDAPEFVCVDQPQAPTTAGAVCRAMKAEGVTDVNPSHPKLTALLAAGVTLDELTGAARLATSRGKGFAYTLGTLERQRAEAASMAATLHRGPMPNRADALRAKNHAAMSDWLATTQEPEDAAS